MQSVYSFYKLVDKGASQIEKLNLSCAQLAEYSNVLRQLQQQVETGEPRHKIMDQWQAYLSKFSVPMPEIAGRRPRHNGRRADPLLKRAKYSVQS